MHYVARGKLMLRARDRSHVDETGAMSQKMMMGFPAMLQCSQC